MAKDHSHCTGCSLCLLACPVWRQSRDIRHTPHGRAKAMQHGAGSMDIVASVAQCTLCGSCEPACPEQIPLVEMILGLRREQPLAQMDFEAVGANPPGATLLLAGKALDGQRRQRIAALLDCAIGVDDGADIALAIEAGVPLPEGRLQGFLDDLRAARTLIVAQGLLLRRLREWMPGARVVSLGEALSAHQAVRAKLQPRDLYVIEPRAFHADHARLLGHYDALRAAKGFATNLDLQRLAVATTASAAQNAFGLPAVDAKDQARWILEGRDYDRVVVEDPADCAVFAAVTDRPVVHLADL